MNPHSTSPRDLALLAGPLVRVPFLIRKTRPMTARRRRLVLAAPTLGMGIGAARMLHGARIDPDDTFTREDLADLARPLAESWVFETATAAIAVRLHTAFVGDRTSLTPARAVAYALSLGSIAVVRRYAHLNIERRMELRLREADLAAAFAAVAARES